MTTKVVQYRAIQAEIKRLEKELSVIEEDPIYVREAEFVRKLDDLLAEYGKSYPVAIAILDPERVAREQVEKSTRSDAGKPRKINRYKNPHTGEVVESASGNNKTLKLWKTEYPGVNIKDWIEA